MAHKNLYSDVYHPEYSRGREDSPKSSNKKVGLARLAKTRSLSSSINKLNNEDFTDIEENHNNSYSSSNNIPTVIITQFPPIKPKSAPPSVVGSPPKWSPMSWFSSIFPSLSKRRSTLSLPENPTPEFTPGRRSSEASVGQMSSPETPTSPYQHFGKETAPVPILPNKINVANLGYQHRDKRSGEGSESPGSLRFDQVPRSDPELFSNNKPLRHGNASTSSMSIEVPSNSIYNKSPVKPKIIQNSEGISGSLNNSPLIKRKNKLKAPSIKKSNSYSHLADAFQQVHNVCINPASHGESNKIRPELVQDCLIKTSQAPSNLLVGRDRRGRATSWYPTDLESDRDYSDQTSTVDTSSDNYGYKTQESPSYGSDVDGQRISAYDEASGGLPNFNVGEAKQKNYLCGGLGNLLGESELLRYHPDRTLTIFIATWNMNGKEPPVNLEEFILPKNLNHLPDLYVIGTQESGGDRSEWEVRLQTTIGPSHVLFTSAMLGILHLIVFLRRDLIWFCSVAEESSHSLRPGTYFKTKGAVSLGFQFFGTRILFINSHLFAHEEKQNQRIQNYKNIISSLDIPKVLPPKSKYKTGSSMSDVTQRYDVVFWLGDLNFRLLGNRDDVVELLNRNNTYEVYEYLLLSDQLNDARRNKLAFDTFQEGPIHFPPTFKYDPGTNDYDSSSKQRVPSYTDRILFKSNSSDPVSCVVYDSCPIFQTSDHKPVWGVYQFKIRQGNDNIPLAAGMFNREVYLEGLKRRRTMLSPARPNNCKVQ